MKTSVCFPNQGYVNVLPPKNNSKEDNSIQNPMSKQRFKNGFSFGDLEDKFSSGSPSSPIPNIPFSNNYAKKSSEEFAGNAVSAGQT